MQSMCVLYIEGLGELPMLIWPSLNTLVIT